MISAHEEPNHEVLHAHAKDNDCFFAIAKSKTHNTIVIPAVISDSAHVKRRMGYASSRPHFLKQVSAILASSVQVRTLLVHDVADLDLHAQFSVTEVEHAIEHIHIDDRSSIPATSSSGSGIKFDFSVLDAPVRDFMHASTSVGKLLEISINIASETVSCGSLQTFAPADRPPFMVGIKEPRFYLVGVSSPVFVYMCPDDAAVRAKMVYSSIKPGLLSHLLQQCNLTVNKRVECASVDEFDLVLEDNQQPQNEEEASAKPQRVAKPARAGRGAAKLI